MAKTSSALCFTDAEIFGLPYAADASKRVERRDSVLPGLVLRIGRRTKTFYLVTTASGALIKRKLGLFPGVGVDRARALAAAHLKREVRICTRSQSSPHSVVGNFPDIELLTTRQAATLTKMSMAWFERKRWEGLGPPYYRRGRSVRYVKHELLSWWLESRVSDEPE